MKKVTVYYFKKWDDSTHQNLRSKHPGTLEAIKRAEGTELMETALEVDEAELDDNGFWKKQSS